MQNYKSGELALLDVPVPGCKPGGVLVRTAYSLISTGTELMKVSEAGMSMLGKARSRPDQVAKVVQSVATNGVPATYRKVMGKLDSYTPLGYSLCGVVEQVGEGIDDVKAGDLVACAGNEHALHAELNWVPRNLYAPVPDGLAARDAAFGTVGSIALQGVRQGESRLGETALVIGLGLIGQLVVQLLVASGVRVVGADPDAERCELAERLGAAACGDPASPAVESAVAELTDGHGVDQVYLAAGGGSNQPVELAARLCRDRGRVVDIGKCRLDLPWNAYYEKELDVRFSRSYGPGRYDPEYELEGRDYPIGYVRWTERRNLACFLDLVARGRVDVAPLITRTADFDDAVETYRSLQDGALKAVAVLFRYPGQPDAESPAGAPAVTVPGVRRGAVFGRTGTGRPDTGAPGLRRRRQLRDVDAAAASGPARGRRAVDGRHHDGAVRGQRAAQVRVRGGDDRSGRRARRRVRGRGVRGHPAQLARRTDPQGAAGRQGRLRGEAAGADRGGADRSARGGGGVRQRPGAGGLQPPVRAAAPGGQQAVRRPHRTGQPALPRQRGAARPRQLVSPAGHRGLAVRRRGRSLRRHGELAPRGRPRLGLRARPVGQRGPSGRAGLPGRVHRHPQLRHHRSGRIPQGDAGPGRGRQGAAARRLRPQFGLRRPQAVGQFAAAQGPGQGPVGRTGRVRPGGADRRADAGAARVAGRHHGGHPRRADRSGRRRSGGSGGGAM
ncbi:LOW QUALITY PROTEIN: bi-domain-containing oxidoreductase, partial [Streptomyces lividans TK24]